MIYIPGQMPRSDRRYAETHYGIVYVDGNGSLDDPITVRAPNRQRCLDGAALWFRKVIGEPVEGPIHDQAKRISDGAILETVFARLANDQLHTLFFTFDPADTRSPSTPRR